MKQFLFAAFMMVALSITASPTDPIDKKESKTIKTTESSVVWVGKKVTGQHTGTININSGQLDFDNNVLVGGKLTIDMNTIKCTDLDEGGAKKLEGHLKSDDFFGVSTHQNAELLITKVSSGKTNRSYNISADITIKGITKPIEFTAEIGDSESVAKVIINRTDFDIRYGSGSFFDDLGDKMIYDDFELDIQLKY